MVDIILNQTKPNQSKANEPDQTKVSYNRYHDRIWIV